MPRDWTYFFVKKTSTFIQKHMENNYDDSALLDDYEKMAKAYSQSLKNKGFVFIRLQEEEFELLLGEIFVLTAKMKACLTKLQSQLDSKVLYGVLCETEGKLKQKFGNKKTHNFRYLEDENCAFLTLISLNSTLMLKLMILSVKSGELELCNELISSITAIFSQSFSCEGFVLQS